MRRLSISHGLVTLVDDDVYAWASQVPWKALKVKNTFYAVRQTTRANGIRPRTILLHREIMDPPVVMEINHVDGDGLNNTRKNLEVVTKSRNRASFATPRSGKTSAFRGVYFHKKSQKWMARAHADYQSFYLGIFEDEADAAKARDAAMIKLYGPTIQLNFPRT